MTLILEFEHKLIFYKPGILRYAMRQAGPQLCAARSCAERRQVLSLSLKRGWAEAKSQLAGFRRLWAAAPAGREARSQQARHDALQIGDGSRRDVRPIRNRMELAPPEAAPLAALTHRQLH